ncbi:MAG: LysR family transcriptional regulator [Trichococcus sp.]|uniref:LysR family transcriptional regulator n=1 Tax=Trichococcus sp. TaxID=1985464 RepID=UPI003C556560
MDIQDLKYFIEISKTGSITKASKNTYISPQGLSSVLQKMEKELGIVLMERSPNGARPNEYGQILLKKAEAILEIYAELQNEIGDLYRRTQGFIRLVSAYGALRLLTPDFIFGFADAFPDVHLDYMEFPDRYVEEMIDEEKADIGFAVGPVDTEKYEATLLYSEDLYLLVRDEDKLADCKSVSFMDIKDKDFIIESDMFKMHDLFIEKCREYDFEPRIVFNTSGYSLCHKLCSQGRGASITLRSNFSDMKSEGLSAIPFEGDFQWKLYVITKKGKVISDTLKNFMEYAVKWKIG